MLKLKDKYFNQFLEAPLSVIDYEYLKYNKKKLLKTDQFSSFLTFGTGGMRQIVELGTNRFNKYNIAKLTLCVLNWLTLNIRSKKKNMIVIGYDSRNTSEAFSRLIYHLVQSQEFCVKIFKQPTPTPLISFAVRELQAKAGIILTASHNPSQYNGYKLMLSNGGQILSPHDQIIQKNFVDFPYKNLPQDIHKWKELSPLKEDIIEEDIIVAYIKRLQKESFVTSNSKKINIIYSPLHGTGGWVFKRVFYDLGYKNFSIIKEQAEPDGNFPTIKSPNPEEESSFDMLKRNNKGAQILIATDPDGDRVGISIKKTDHTGLDNYIFLTGNQIGCLILKSLLDKIPNKLSEPYICKTIVTTELQKKIAKAYGVRTIETLTGFKYIADVLDRDPKNYLFGGEESFGYLPVNWIRDKDSISSAIVITEMANQKNLLRELESLYIKFGLYHEELYNISLDDHGLSFIHKMKTNFLRSSLFINKKFGTREVIDYINLNHKSISDGDEPVTEEGKHLYNSLPESNVLQLWFKPEGRITIRPSGTEPKIKIYLSLRYHKEVVEDTIDIARRELKKEGNIIGQNFLDFFNIKR